MYTPTQTEHLSLYASTPQLESALAFVQVLVDCGMPLQIADFKNAF